MQLIDLSHAAALLSAANDILVVPHIRPDGDAAGSACALCLGLRALGKRAYIAPDPPNMKRYEKYMTPWFAPAGFVPGFIAAVDTPGPGQFPPGLEALADKTDLAVDHHGTNSGHSPGDRRGPLRVPGHGHQLFPHPWHHRPDADHRRRAAPNGL